MSNKTLEIGDALSIYQCVWLVGEPLIGYHKAREALAPKMDVGVPFQVWNIVNGLITDTRDIERGFSGTLKQERDASQELLQGLLASRGLIVMAEGLKLGASVIGAALKAIEENRRIVFVSGVEPPPDFLPDYLYVATADDLIDEESVRAACEANDVEDTKIKSRANATYDDSYMPPLSGLRRYVGSSLLLEALKFADKGKVPEYLYQLRAAAIARDSDGILRLENPETTFKDLIGMSRIKKLISALASKVSKDHPVRGMMSVGLPGTGKSRLIQAAAGEVGKPLYVVDLGSVADMYVGQSQARARRYIKVLKSVPAGLILLDEIEKSLSASGTGSASTDSGSAQQSNAYLLDYLTNPVADSGNSFHVVMATSNDIFKLPAEWTRAGRWDAISWFGYPSQKTLLTVLKKYREENDLPKTFGKDANLLQMTPAEIESVCRIAATLETGEWREAYPYVPVLSKFRADDVAEMEKKALGFAVAAYDSDDEMAGSERGKVK